MAPHSALDATDREAALPALAGMVLGVRRVTDIPADAIKAAREILRPWFLDDRVPLLLRTQVAGAAERALEEAVARGIVDRLSALEQRVDAIEPRTMGLMQFGTQEIMWAQIEKARSSE